LIGAGSPGDLAALLHLRKTAAMKTTLTVTSRGVVTLPAKLRQALRRKKRAR